MLYVLEKSDVDAIQSLIDDLKAQLATKTQQLTDATNTLSSSCDSRLATLQTQVDATTGTTTAISTLQSTVSGHTTSIGQHTTSIAQNASTVATLQNTIATLQNTITANQTALAQNQATMAAQKATIDRMSLMNSRAGSYVTLYSWNAAGYDQVIAAKQKNPHVPIIAALNPNSGPGSAKATVIDTACQALKAAGVIVIGYVGTNYGSELTKRQYPVGNPWPSDNPKDLASVKAECDKWVQWYGVDGFMFDDYQNTQNITLPDGSTKDVYNTFYVPLVQYVRSLTGIKYIKGNMGTKPTYMPLADLCDWVCVFENSRNPTLAEVQTNTLNGQLRNKAMVVVNTVATLDKAAITSFAPYCKWYYASNAGYNAVPTYYDAAVTTLAGL